MYQVHINSSYMILKNVFLQSLVCTCMQRIKPPKIYVPFSVPFHIPNLISELINIMKTDKERNLNHSILPESVLTLSNLQVCVL